MEAGRIHRPGKQWWTGLKRPRLGNQNSLVKLHLNLSFPSYSIPHPASPPGSFSSRGGLAFLRVASHVGWWSTTCQTSAPLILRGCAEPCVLKGLILQLRREKRTRLPSCSSPWTQRTPSANTRYSLAYFQSKGVTAAKEGLRTLLRDRSVSSGALREAGESVQGARGHGREWSGAGEAGQWCAGGVFVGFFFFWGWGVT